MTRKETIMPSFDLKKYIGPRFVKPDHVREKPLRDTIVRVQQGKFDKLELLLESGDILSLNATNTETLMNAYGRNSDHLVGKEIEFYFGQLQYNGSGHDAVLVKPISPADKIGKTEGGSKPIDFDDDVPFGPEWRG
jgi:hypothetical protein